jgi:hypothetical protein
MASRRSKSGEPKSAVSATIRQKSSPSTPVEKQNASNVCFNEGDLVTFIFTHRNIGWYLGGAAGVHLGMKVVLKPGTGDQQTITVGFYPKKKGGGMLNPVEGALFIPDPAVTDSLADKIKYTQLNRIPFELSVSAAGKLNNYTCSDEPGTKIDWSIKKEENDDGGEGESKTASFRREVTTPDFSYKFHNVFGATCPGATNCQGFITRIFSEDQEILDKIIPFLHPKGSREVADEAARQLYIRQQQEAKKRYQDKIGTYSDGTARTPASMGIVAGFIPRMGGKKKRHRRKKRKTRKKTRRRKRKRKTRRRRKSRKRRS